MCSWGGRLEGGVKSYRKSCIIHNRTFWNFAWARPKLSRQQKIPSVPSSLNILSDSRVPLQCNMFNRIDWTRPSFVGAPCERNRERCLRALNAKPKFMRPFDTVLVYQLSVCHFLAFYLDRLTAHILSKHTHTHMLIQVYYVTKRVCVVCVSVWPFPLL